MIFQKTYFYYTDFSFCIDLTYLFYIAFFRHLTKFIGGENKGKIHPRRPLIQFCGSGFNTKGTKRKGFISSCVIKLITVKLNNVYH